MTRAHDTATTEYADKVWSQTRSLKGTVAEAYLRHRGITADLPDTLRFHPNLKHSATGTFWPAHVGRVTTGEQNEPIGIHRTFINQDGSDKAPVEPAKMMLGRASGGSVRLAPASDILMIGEGIETCLSVLQVTHRPVWATLSTSGLRTIELPGSVQDVTILADGDKPGEEAAMAAAKRLSRTVRIVRIVRAPSGCDFNDVLTGRTPDDGEASS